MAKMTVNEAYNELSKLLKMFDALKNGVDILAVLHEATSNRDALHKEIDALRKEAVTLDNKNDALANKVLEKERYLIDTEEHVTAMKKAAEDKAQMIISTANIEAEELRRLAREAVDKFQTELLLAKEARDKAINDLRDAQADLSRFKATAEQERERIKKTLGV